MEQLGKVGLALSGGGAKGYAHIGVLKYLDEKGLKISRLAGTSMGSIVGALYCSGHSPSSIVDLFCSQSMWTWFKVNFFKTGLVNLSGAKALLEENIGHNSFDDLEIPMYVVASNLNTGKPKVISEGNNLVEWVIASSSVPLAFSPVVIDNETYVDGGLFMNLPAEPLSFSCDTVIASNVVPDSKMPEIKGARAVAERIFNLSLVQNMRISKRFSDVFIEPKNINDYSMWDFKKIDELLEIGYNTAKQSFEIYIDHNRFEED